MIEKYDIDIILIGNGIVFRELEIFVLEMIKEIDSEV